MCDIHETSSISLNKLNTFFTFDGVLSFKRIHNMLTYSWNNNPSLISVIHNTVLSHTYVFGYVILLHDVEMVCFGNVSDVSHTYTGQMMVIP